MNKVIAPSLDDVLERNAPAWLWDADQPGIVWANSAGVDWFGVETLFDVLDMVFDESNQTVASINNIANHLRRGHSQDILVDFAGGKANTPLNCTCYVHALADGRNGLLIVADEEQESQNVLSPAIQALALGAFPLPVLVMNGALQILFANERARDIVELRAIEGKTSPAGILLERAYKKGLVSQNIKLPGASKRSGANGDNTSGRQRDFRIIIRPLELADRLADSSFLIVLEDITNRRALEQKLLEAASQGPVSEPTTDKTTDREPHQAGPQGNETPPNTSGLQTASKDRPEDRSQETSPNQPAPDQTSTSQTAAKPVHKADVAQTLSHLRSEIENQTGVSRLTQARGGDTEATGRTETGPGEKNDGEKDDGDDNKIIPEIVSATLNKLPQPLALISQEGELVFANDACVELMGVKSWPEIGKITLLADALGALEGEDGEVSVFTAEDEPLNLEAIASKFPWKSGAVWQFTLSIGDDGEAADNRRAPSAGNVKKNR